MEEEYAYINNQGYILEVNSGSLELPLITGYSTEEIKSGNRLDVKDLKKLNTVIQIIKSANEKGLENKITKLDITQTSDIVISIESENKVVHLGDGSNISEKIVRLKAVLEDTVNEYGEIYVQNIEKVYFRKEV